MPGGKQTGSQSQQETGQRLEYLLDEERPRELGLPSPGRRRRLGGDLRSPRGEDSRAVLPPAKLFKLPVPWDRVTLQTFFQTDFQAYSRTLFRC